MSIELSGQQITTMRVGLQKSFTSQTDFDMFMQEQVDRALGDYAAPSDTIPSAMFKVIRSAEAEGWIDELILKSIETRPKRPEFAKLANDLGIGVGGANLLSVPTIAGLPTVVASSYLQDIVRPHQQFQNVEVFFAQGMAIQSRICHFEIDDVDDKGRPIQRGGTGFLVASDLVLTNYHVVKRVIDGEILPSKVKLRFDFRMSADRAITRHGKTYDLAAQWNVDSSPFSPVDKEAEPQGDPADNELDYCLLRLATAVGEVGFGGSETAEARGSIATTLNAPAGQQGDPILIFQHPDGEPLKLAMGMHQGLNQSSNRVRYDANTLGGSSGSPVFNSALQLIGLHHRGDPASDAFNLPPQHNQGIPINKILSNMSQNGVDQFWT